MVADEGVDPVVAHAVSNMIYTWEYVKGIGADTSEGLLVICLF